MLKKISLLLFFVCVTLMLYFLNDDFIEKEEIIPNTVAVAFNDKIFEFESSEPVVNGTEIYLPINIFNQLEGAEIIYDKENNLVLLGYREQEIKVSTLNGEIELNGHKVEKFSGKMKYSRALLPLAFLKETYGWNSQYLKEGPVLRISDREVILTKDKFLNVYKDGVENFYLREKQRKEKMIEEQKRLRYERLKGERKTKKIAYLTFDDGPNAATPIILDILKEKGVKATFFVLGENVLGNENLVKRIDSEGHFIALHSMTHRKDLLYKREPSRVAEEMLQLQEIIRGITNKNIKLTRAPYGSKPYMTKPYRDEMVKNEFKMWDWTVDSKDWKYNELNSEMILTEVKAQVDKRVEVLLFHDKKATALVLRDVIDYLEQMGYSIEEYKPEFHEVHNFWKDERL